MRGAFSLVATDILRHLETSTLGAATGCCTSTHTHTHIRYAHICAFSRKDPNGTRMHGHTHALTHYMYTRGGRNTNVSMLARTVGVLAVKHVRDTWDI